MTLNLVIEYFDGVFLVLLVVFVFLQQFIISRVNRTLSPDQRFPRFRKGILPLIYVPSVVHPRSAIAGDYHTLYPRTRLLLLNRVLKSVMLCGVAGLLLLTALQIWTRR
ncbi:MAG: hypothetical protein WA734_17265 [Candidatus Acidiferrales bacterium]